MVKAGHQRGKEAERDGMRKREMEAQTNKHEQTDKHRKGPIVRDTETEREEDKSEMQRVGPLKNDRGRRNAGMQTKEDKTQEKTSEMQIQTFKIQSS